MLFSSIIFIINNFKQRSHFIKQVKHFIMNKKYLLFLLLFYFCIYSNFIFYIRNNFKIMYLLLFDFNEVPSNFLNNKISLL